MTGLRLAVESERSRIDTLTRWLPRIGAALFFLMIGSQKFTDPVRHRRRGRLERAAASAVLRARCRIDGGLS